MSLFVLHFAYFRLDFFLHLLYVKCRVHIVIYVLVSGKATFLISHTVIEPRYRVLR